MLKTVIVGLALTVPSYALACGGSKSADHAKAQTEAQAETVSATNCAKKADLVGANCSYTTGMMAQRVVTEGGEWTYSGTLTSTSNDLGTKVAAPYAVGAKGDVHIVANEVLESLTTAGLSDKRLALEGRKLDVEGVTYVVLTGFAPMSS